MFLLLNTLHPTLTRMNLTWPCHDPDAWTIVVPDSPLERSAFDGLRLNMPELKEIQLGGTHIWPDPEYVFTSPRNACGWLILVTQCGQGSVVSCHDARGQAHAPQDLRV